MPLKPFEQADLAAYVHDKFLTLEEIDQLDSSTRIYLNHPTLRAYVKQQKISIAQVKRLTEDEFTRLTSEVTPYLIKQGIVSLDECLTLNTRRAIVLTAPNVTFMVASFILSPRQAIKLDNTFEFLDENHALKTEVFYNKYSPELAVQVDLFYRLFTWVAAIAISFKNVNDALAEYAFERLSLTPETASQCCALLYVRVLFNEAVNQHRNELIRSSPKVVLDYFYAHPVFIPRSFNVNLQQKMSHSMGYRDYCYSLIKLSFRFFQSTAQAASIESGHNQDRCIRAVGHHFFSLWHSNYPKLSASDRPRIEKNSF